MKTFDEFKTILEAACKAKADCTNPYRCALDCLQYSLPESQQRSTLTAMCIDNGLCSESQAWAVMGGWDDQAKWEGCSDPYDFVREIDQAYYDLGRDMAKMCGFGV